MESFLGVAILLDLANRMQKGGYGWTIQPLSIIVIWSLLFKYSGNTFYIPLETTGPPFATLTPSPALLIYGVQILSIQPKSHPAGTMSQLAFFNGRPNG